MAPKVGLVAYHPVHGYAMKPVEQDLRTIKRNARERNRVQTVNSTYEALRRAIPAAAVHKKMSKVNIIYHALDYIHQLMYMMHSTEHSMKIGHNVMDTKNMMYSEPTHQFIHHSEQNHQLVQHHSNVYQQNTVLQTTPRPASCSSVDSGLSPSTFSPSTGSPAAFYPDYNSTQHHQYPAQLPQQHNFADLPNRNFADFYQPQRSFTSSQDCSKPCTVPHNNQYSQYSTQTEDDVLDAIVEWQST